MIRAAQLERRKKRKQQDSMKRETSQKKRQLLTDGLRSKSKCRKISEAAQNDKRQPEDPQLVLQIVCRLARITSCCPIVSKFLKIESQVRHDRCTSCQSARKEMTNDQQKRDS